MASPIAFLYAPTKMMLVGLVLLQLKSSTGEMDDLKFKKRGGRGAGGEEEREGENRLSVSVSKHFFHVVPF